MMFSAITTVVFFFLSETLVTKEIDYFKSTSTNNSSLDKFCS